MKDSVFESIVQELPVDSTEIEVYATVLYVSNGRHHAQKERAYFPSKSQVTFKREGQKMTDAIRSFEKDVKEAVATIRAFEAHVNKRLSKLEKKDGSAKHDDSDPAVGS